MGLSIMAFPVLTTRRTFRKAELANDINFFFAIHHDRHRYDISNLPHTRPHLLHLRLPHATSHTD